MHSLAIYTGNTVGFRLELQKWEAKNQTSRSNVRTCYLGCDQLEFREM